MKTFGYLLLTIFLLTKGSNSYGALIGYYNLNAASGSIPDSSGSGSTPGTGAVAGSGLSYSQATAPAGNYGAYALTPSTVASFGTAISHTGSAGNFAFPNASISNLVSSGGAGTFTAMAWINIANSATVKSILTSTGDTGDGTNGWKFRVDAGGDLEFKTNAIYSADTNLVSGTWAHVAVTYNSGAITFYVNGTSAGTATSTAYTDESGTIERKLFGQRGGILNFDGSMDEFRIYDNVLTQSEIVTASGLTAIPEPASSLAFIFLGACGVAVAYRKR